MRYTGTSVAGGQREGHILAVGVLGMLVAYLSQVRAR